MTSTITSGRGGDEDVPLAGIHVLLVIQVCPTNSCITYVKWNNTLECITVLVERRGFIFWHYWELMWSCACHVGGSQLESPRMLAPYHDDSSSLPYWLSFTSLVAAVCTSYFLKPVIFNISTTRLHFGRCAFSEQYLYPTNSVTVMSNMQM